MRLKLNTKPVEMIEEIVERTASGELNPLQAVQEIAAAFASLGGIQNVVYRVGITIANERNRRNTRRRRRRK
jgi:hypothetical protein